VLARAQNSFFPFCSDRCRAIDLGRWLGEEFRVPTRTTDDDEDGGGVQGDGGPQHDA
jgi:endogenous inhibitor of DNA gyrase (YacG/DUF329 family)